MNENWTEKLIDAHLEAPNAVESSLGFESRLLAQVAERRATRRSPAFWMVWASTAAVAAVIAIVLFTRPVAQKPAPVETAKTSTPAQSMPAGAVPSVGRSPLVARRNVPKQRRDEGVAVAVNARQEVFPAPAPLSEQERMAFAYLRGTPRSEVIAMSRPEPELPQEINQAIPGPEVNRTLPSSTR